ncbi:MAG: alpha/beta hydrolase [Chloroflexota bacterium]|nr:alpha/beta hydrolase [Chloroflexota bacterium]MDQ5867847.1 alpha/beta hydrolase [Chloroflexota bacterium]
MNKPTLLLLHGAIGASGQFAPLVPLLNPTFDLHLLDFEGHGSAPLRSRPFSMEHFAENVLDYLEQHSIERAHIFGYSMGGYVACLLARSHPHVVESIATLGTKFYWDADIAEREMALLDPQKIAAKVPRFATTLAERHTAAGWEQVLGNTRELLRSLGRTGGLSPDDVGSIEQRVRVMIGDRDATVTLAESLDIYKALPRGELEVLPATPHQFEKVPLERLAYTLSQFFTQG